MIQDVSDLTSFKWAVVTAVSPLAIKLDGDTTALSVVPDSLVDPLELVIGDRVRVELSMRKTIIHGVANGGGQSGEIKMTASSSAPRGWLLAQGQSLLRASYPRLFSAIGTAYGAADSTHFNLPNLKGRVPVGLDAGQTEFNALGKTGGQKTTRHGFYVPGINSGSAQVGGNNYQNAVATQLNSYLQGDGSSPIDIGVVIQAVGGSITGSGTGNIEVRHGRYTAPNLQPYIALNFIIKT